MKARPRPKRYLRKLAARAQKRQDPPIPTGPDLRPYQVILRPIVTEKSTHLSTRSERRPATDDGRPTACNAYTFEVRRHATKTQIREAVQELFGVRVEHVSTQNHLGKRRRYKFRIGRLADWKKAIVTLHPEDKIEFF
jgi:large subunit ribosomal protein L23